MLETAYSPPLFVVQFFVYVYMCAFVCIKLPVCVRVHVEAKVQHQLHLSVIHTDF